MRACRGMGIVTPNSDPIYIRPAGTHRPLKMKSGDSHRSGPFEPPTSTPISILGFTLPVGCGLPVECGLWVLETEGG